MGGIISSRPAELTRGPNSEDRWNCCKCHYGNLRASSSCGNQHTTLTVESGISGGINRGVSGGGLEGSHHQKSVVVPCGHGRCSKCAANWARNIVNR